MNRKAMQNSWINKRRKYAMAGIVVFLLAGALSLGIELAFFQYPILKEGESQKTYTLHDNLQLLSEEEVWTELSAEEQTTIELEQENEKLLAQVNGETYSEETDSNLKEENGKLYRRRIETKLEILFEGKQYCGNVTLLMPQVVENLTYTLAGIGPTSEILWQSNLTELDYRLACDVLQIGKRFEKLQLTIYSSEKVTGQDIQVEVKNQSSIHWIRVCYFFVVMLILSGALLFIIKKLEQEKKKAITGQEYGFQIETIFFVASLVLGLLLMLSNGTNLTGFDEHTHFARAYAMSFDTTIETTESAMRMKANDIPQFDNREERRLVEAYEEHNHDFSWADISTQSRFVTYSDRSYLPMGIFMRMGRAMSLSFANMIMLAKFGNLLAYSLLGFLAVKFALHKKEMVAAIALLPNCIFAASGFSYDAIVNGFLLLAVVLTVNLLSKTESKIAPITVFLILGAYIGGSTAKPVYMIMAFILVFLSDDRFLNKGKAWLFRFSVFALVALFLYVIFFPPISTSANYELMGNLAYAGDRRNQGTSVLGQLTFIFQDPLRYSKILLGMMGKDLVGYLMGPGTFFNYGYLGGLSWGWTLTGSLLLLFGSLSGPDFLNEQEGLGKKDKILTAIMIFGLTAVIYTSMYVTYTPVGSAVIEGVQGRYFIPLLLPFVYLLSNKKRKLPVPKAIYQVFVIGFPIVANLWMIYRFALKP